MAGWTPQTRISVNIYWLITGLFGLSYGIYGYYVFIYLAALNKQTATFFLEPLLFILAMTMVFELVAEPLSGRFADLFGRRRSVILAFLLVGVALAIYALAGLSMFRNSPNSILALAITAELVIAIGLAFHTGSLDAWIVEQVYHHEHGKSVSTEPIFGRGNQWFAGGLTLGGVIGSYAVPDLQDQTQVIGITWPWLLSCAVALLAMLIAAAAIHGTGSDAATAIDQSGSDGNIFRQTLSRLAKLPRSNRQLKLAILVTSSIYMIGIAFIYFSTLLANYALTLVGFSKWLIAMPVLFLIPRLLGPWLAVRLTSGLTPEADQTYRTLMRNVGLLAAASSVALGIAVHEISRPIYTVANPPSGILFAFSCITFFLTSLFVQASRPITSSYLNYYVPADSDRAFLNSMATPFGGIMVAILCFILILVNHGQLAPQRSDIALVFAAPGIVAFIAILVTTRPPRVR